MAMMFRGLGKPTDELNIQLAQPSDPFGFRGQPSYELNAQQPLGEGKPQGGMGLRDIVGIIGEALGGAAGNGPGAYTQSKLRDREIAERQRQAVATRGAEWQDWVAKQQYEAANPKPVNNDTINDYNFYAGKFGTEYADKYLKDKNDPVVSIPLPGGQSYVGPRSQLEAVLKGGGQASGVTPGGAPSASLPAKPVGKLTPIGGGGGNVTGNFR